jgi:hypothetical protein
MNALEVEFLFQIEFKLHISEEDYLAYHQHISAHMTTDSYAACTPPTPPPLSILNRSESSSTYATTGSPISTCSPMMSPKHERMPAKSPRRGADWTATWDCSSDEEAEHGDGEELFQQKQKSRKASKSAQVQVPAAKIPQALMRHSPYLFVPDPPCAVRLIV